MADKAILYLKDLRAVDSERPFFVCFAPGARNLEGEARAALAQQ